MKELLILRHAKAETDSADGSDHARELTGRGERNAASIGRALALSQQVPTQIVSSTAARAKKTAELAAKASGFKGIPSFTEDIYEAHPVHLLEVLRSIQGPSERVLLVGHNPGMEGLVGMLCSTPAAKPGWSGPRMATGTVVLLQLQIEAWSDLVPGCGDLEWILPPRLAEALLG